MLRLRRHVLDQVRRDLLAARRQQVPAHRQQRDGRPSSSATWAACSTSKVGCAVAATRRRGCCTSPRCWPASSPNADPGLSPPSNSRSAQDHAHASRLDALQGARSRQDERRAAPAEPAEDQGQVRRQAARVDHRARRLRGNARGRQGDPQPRAGEPRRLARDVRAERRRPAARRCCSPRRRPTSTRWCSRSRAKHAVRKIIKSKSMVSEESALDQAIEAAGLTVVETDLGEYILQINDYEPPSHIIGPALHKSKEEVADLFHAKHGTPRKTDIARALPRGARRAAAALPDRRHGHLGRQFLRRRDRIGGPRHQRGQRDADDDAAEGARGDLGHREDRADAGGRRRR